MVQGMECGGVGDPVLRREDARMVTGRGRYVDDTVLPGMVHAAFVRSDHAHAKIVSIDASAARAAPGVIAVLTGTDFLEDGLGDLPCESMPPAIVREWHRTPFPALIADEVRAVGDPVAMIVASTAREARDAVELVDVNYEPLPAVASIAAALEPGAILVHDIAPGNLCFDTEIGDETTTKKAFEAAAHIIELSTEQPRLAHAPMEPRGAVGSYDANEERYTLVASAQNPHSLKRILAQSVLRIPANKIRVVARDVGGSFGLKGRLYPEDILVLWAAKRVGRPIKWIATRIESFLSDFHGRDQTADGRAAFDADGRILGLEVATRHNLGCRLGPATGVSPFLTARMIVGPYDIPAAHVRVQGVFSHTRTTTSYRGAGRPEATFYIERILDKAAAALGLDPVDIRRRNLVPTGTMPYQNALVDTYDCGEFEAVLDKALGLADWDGFEGRRAASAQNGKWRGRGICCFVEVCAIGNERMELRFDPTGRVQILAGTMSHGQGHETVYSQMVSDWLGLPFDEIAFLNGDTDIVSHGGGTYASRSMTVGGSALRLACNEIVTKGKSIAAWMMSEPVESIEFSDGLFSAEGTNQSISIGDVAIASYRPIGFPADLGVGLEAIGYFTAMPQNYPNGCHIVEVEIDTDFLTVTVDRYIAVDDTGAVANPLLLEGQLHGSAAQGIGQVLFEQIIYEENGQLLTAAFTEYSMPRADHMPTFLAQHHPTMTATNPLGIKGGAEAGTIGAPPAIIQAIENALSDHGVREMPIPANPKKIAQALASQV